MANEEKTLSVSRIIDHSAKDIFDTLSLPQRHPQFDGSGMVRSADNSERIQATGDVFVMNMVGRTGTEYQTHNHVTAFDDGKMVGWKPALAENPGEPGGWEWLYTLKPLDAHSTDVTLTYSWGAVTDKKLAESLPLITEEEMEQSLNLLASAIN
ncbi:SRPBCC family protein [Flaviflexus equikiangi]|uniref:Polyketide cyclase n=1 Tax=Flaviflexus equikiangi TaxID=2758573 RepID=A0ABS2TBW3_9ACTO|nr:SRPBCC domain-containing protein [Flaviflexus equikiangi]MBM9432135.1 polyketide cyclase [Flaviflexus equikiangi]